MRWKQFFTPVKSIKTEQARELVSAKSSEGLTIVDVRQPAEYEAGHIPGAKLIPLPELMERLDEIDSNKSIMVYCAIGGRSRVAAQMLAGKGYNRCFFGIFMKSFVQHHFFTVVGPSLSSFRCHRKKSNHWHFGVT